MNKEKLMEIQKTIAEWQGRAKEKQKHASKELGPLFRKNERKEPGKFIESSYLYIRSCDADQGFRPIPCPVFWLSPDIRVTPISGVGSPTRELVAGEAYRLTALVRNRGDLTVPAAKVEFFLVNPTLGFDTRFATRIGVGQTWVDAYGAAEISVDYMVPPDLSGHYCLFARVFSFSPLDLPVSDYALSPPMDRHVVQQNLTIIAGAQSLTMDVIHLPNAAELIELIPMKLADVGRVRNEMVAHLRPVSPTIATELIQKFKFSFEPGRSKGVSTKAEAQKNGLMLISDSDQGFPLKQQAALTKSWLSMQGAIARGKGDLQEFRKLENEYRAMTETQLRSQLRIDIPDVGLKPDQAVAYHVRRTDRTTGMVTGGVTLLVTG